MIPDREPRLQSTRDGEDLIVLGLGALGWLNGFATAVEPRALAVEAPDEKLLAAALGLLSLRRSLMRWGAQATAKVPPPPPTPLHETLQGVLR